MELPKILQSALWSYNLNKLDKNKNKKEIISQVFNHGTWEQVNWVLANYSLSEIKKVVGNPRRGIWLKDALNYWVSVLDINIPDKKFKKAIFSLDVCKR